jgi:hypothetical protein
MFDKNEFKEKFRFWTELNPDANCEEAKLLCESLIPIEFRENYAWLEEQSIAWFLWKKESHRKSKLSEFYEPEISVNYFENRKIM